MAVPLSGSECGLFVLLLLFWFLILNQCERVHSEPTQDKQALLAFISQVPHANRLQWNQSDSPCNWVGVECDPTRSYVSKLRLPGIGLLGPIPLNTLGNLTQLRVISIHSNALIGKLPSDFSNLKLLRSLYIQHNQFSGDFPPSLSELTRLARLDISTNNFTGKIPLSINNLSRLTGLFMQNNHFSGPIPYLNSSRLVDLNISNNHFNGSIPKALMKFPISSFSGNIDLCGGPLQKCKPFSTTPTPPPPLPLPLPLPRIAPKPSHKKSKKLPLGVIIAIAGGVTAFIVLLLMCLIICLMKRKQDDSNNNNNQAQNPTEGTTAVAVAEAGTSSGKDEMKEEECGVKTNKLMLIDEGVYKFNLDDLLRASAEMLGKGSYGISYKATLDEETTVVVKRLKDATLSGKEFEMHVDELGKIRHYNVVPLIAFYHSKNEKLIIYDYMPDGSLSALLHGSRDSGRPAPDWETRIKIATSAAKGLAHLHCSGKIVHGNIKSSNILIRDSDSLDAAVADYGLSTFFSGESSPDDHHRLGGYRAPEVAQTRKATLKSDVYSFGVLLLEMLTGKSPFQKTSVGEEGIDLPRWVQSIVREEWTAEVFDMELMRYEDVEEEMVQLLQIAMTCVATVPDQRPAMLEVVRLIEETIGSGTPPITITP